MTNTHMCFIDDDNGTDGCVFDDNCIDDCDEAVELVNRGEGKCDCRYWRDAKVESDRQCDTQRQLATRNKIKAEIKAEGVARKKQIDANQFQLDMHLLSYRATPIKPQYKAVFAGRHGLIAVKCNC